ncbi:coenzyme F420-0:L-glutamate ligase [Candidatus Bathyarchaeota archaeon]|nr:MAG: coenzyme F420-0:L-glutamate ligase [Candidatus Bathyarchaeota archaeon]
MVDNMQIFPIKTQVVKPGQSLAEIILNALRNQGVQLQDGDILAVASKVVSTATNQIVYLKEVKPSEEAKKLAEKYFLEPEFTELILKESEKIYGGVKKAILTLKNGILTVNAGIDRKNAPNGYVMLWPLNPQLEADKLRSQIEKVTKKKIGVIIVDSEISPLRLGTRGFALAISGFKPIKDYRGEKDIYGKEIVITLHSIADDLASAAHFLMGESSEQTPVVLIRDAPITLDENAKSEDLKISKENCVYCSSFKL